MEKEKRIDNSMRSAIYAIFAFIFGILAIIKLDDFLCGILLTSTSMIFVFFDENLRKIVLDLLKKTYDKHTQDSDEKEEKYENNGPIKENKDINIFQNMGHIDHIDKIEYHVHKNKMKND